MFCGNVNEVNCVLCIAFHICVMMVQCSLSRLSGCRAHPLFGILAENDIKATSYIAVGRRWSTFFFSRARRLPQFASHVSHCGDPFLCLHVVPSRRNDRGVRTYSQVHTPDHDSVPPVVVGAVVAISESSSRSLVLCQLQG